jgi:leader peptidase (prepilin peptidase)/N-methyltransferase
MMTQETFFIALMIFLLGLIIGSFLNVVIYRIPQGESIIFPASKCQYCRHTLKWWQNIPLFSWAILRGKCYFCQTKIALQYPLIEFLTGIIFLLLYLKVGLVWYFPFTAGSFCGLLALVMIDFKYMAVPDSINIAALTFGLIQPHFIYSVLDGLIASLTLYLIGKFSSVLAKKEAMGSADVIVAGTMGALLGFPHFFAALFLAAILAIFPALVWRQRGVPFIPFLALATLIVYLYDDQTTQLLGEIIYG